MKFPGRIVWICCLIVVFSVSCATREKRGRDRRRTTIGLLIPNTDGTRWDRDVEFLIERADAWGVEVIVGNAAGSQEIQNRRAGELIANGADVLVVIPVDPASAGPVVDRADSADVPVLAYQKLILDADPDFYVGPDREAGGYLQARAILGRSSGGGVILLGGSETDPDAYLVRAGQLRAIEERTGPAGISPVMADLYLEPPTATEARRRISGLLDDKGVSGGEIRGIMAYNDEIAAGAIAALDERGLTGSVAVAGWGADLAACRRIIEGTQAATVYPPPREMAVAAVRAAVRLARGMDPEEVVEALKQKGRPPEIEDLDLPALLLEPVIVTRGNMIETVILYERFPVEAIYREKTR